MRSSLELVWTRSGMIALAACLIGHGCTIGDPDDIDFDDFDGSFSHPDGSTRDGGGQAGSGGEEDEDGGTTKPPPKPDAGGDNGVKLEDLPRLLARATCDALKDCLGSAELLADTLGGRDCAELNESLLLASPLRYLSASVDAGLVLFRPEEAETCFSDLRAQSCDVRGSRWPASCKLMLIGTADAGEACTINQDCSGNAFCDLGTLESCPGTCAPLQTEGRPCNHNDDDQCEDGLVCFRGKCEPLGKAGDDCSNDLPRCAPGFVCPDPDSGSECASIPTIYFRKLDESCEIGVELCEPGLVCESVLGSMGVCKHTVAKGASCKRADPNQCPLDQYCDANAPGETGTCRDRPGEGVACLNRAQACADAHVCIDGTCRALAGVEGDCIDDAQCYSGSCSAGGTCEPPLMCDAP